MRSLRHWTYVVAVGAAVLAIGIGFAAISTDAVSAPPEPCRCIPVFDPVVCKGGREFSNQCLADCANAKECKPLPDTVIGPNAD